MSRLSPFRLCTAAGLAVGTAAVSLSMAPAALAAPELLPDLVGPDTAVIGEPFVLTGTDCEATDASKPAVVFVDYFTAADWEDPDGLPVLTLSGAPVGGDWAAVAEFLPAAKTGDYVAVATCEPYSGSDHPLDYPVFEFSLEPAATPPGTPTDTPAPVPAPGPGVLFTGEIRGTSANTPGVASPDSGAATGDRSAPGQKVVKILTGFQPYENVTVTLHSTPTRVGTFTADASGTVRIEFTVPAGTPAGDHTLVYEGDQGTYFQESFTVTAAGTAATADDDDLAYTGASVALPLGLGAGALALGGGLVFLTRRRSAGAAEASQA